MKILITGAAGFIGSNLAMELNKKYPDANLTLFDKFNSMERRSSGNYSFFGDFRNLIKTKGDIISGDLNSENDIKNLFNKKYDFIFHQGAISDTTELNQEEVIKTNFNSFKNFVKYSLETDAKLIYASSAATYGNTLSPNKVGFGELPENVYGYSKLLMDKYTRDILIKNPEAKIIGLRYFNVYGDCEIFKRKTSSMVLQLIKQAIDKKEVRLFKFGEQTRDFVYIKDIVNANLLSMYGKSGIYNIGSGKSVSFNQIVESIEESLKVKIVKIFIENPYSFYQTNTQADLKDTLNGIGYSPKYNINNGIEDYIDKIKNYPINFWNSFYE